MVLLLILLFLAPLANNIPLCALAAILFVVAWNMSELPHFISMVKKAPKTDTAILLITFLLTVFTDLVVAVNIGVVLASLTLDDETDETTQLMDMLLAKKRSGDRREWLESKGNLADLAL